LKELIARDEHIGKQPKQLWVKKKEFQIYGLKTFSDHIYQEKGYESFIDHYVEHLKKVTHDAPPHC
jgi:hypothetical protein